MPQPDRRRAGRVRRAVVPSLTLLLVAAFIAVGVYRLVGDEERPPVDTSGTYQAARQASAFPVASPSPLPPGWRALASGFDSEATGPTLRIGLRAPGGGAVRLVQSAHPSDALLTVELGPKARARGSVNVRGRHWRQYVGEGGVLALVLVEPRRTLILAGTARETELHRLAEALG